ncbi:adenylate/guanylate cyclase domain-containing protein [Parasphingopyxis marina]|uniref:Adenylate/guanylate cyclase domain-containing protein n=1 Tax=Parasphingopyxis marina TaxID=2761622 RepID=A0A842I2H8_9SPHN|nr:adenylate/guanylate cyclase domain-containing protein [Parasphingopyxis marina]MBC2778034.1 adenylate/guanylate cyclase domain-containing protein [Parasphingopyxis marina]
MAIEEPAATDEERQELVDRHWVPWTVRIWSAVGPLRFIACVTLLFIAVLIARFSWTMPGVEEIERVLYDLRATYAMPLAEEDERITIVTYEEDTLLNTGIRSPLDRAILARGLTALDAMEPRAIAIDILIDQETANDEQLVAALNAMRTPTYLAFVTPEFNPNLQLQPRQVDFIDDFHRRITNPLVRPTSVKLEADSDNVVRSWPEQPEGLPPLMANSLAPGHEAFRSHRGSMTYRRPTFQDGAVFTKLPIDFFGEPEEASFMADFVRGRYILIGTDIPDVDRFETPRTRLRGDPPIAGVEVHAHLLSQMLDGTMLRAVPRWALWATAFLVVLAGALTSLSDLRLWKLGLLIILQAAFLVFVPFALHRAGTDTQTLPVFGWGAGWMIAFTAVGAAARSVGAEKRQYVQGALNKYLPSDVATQILADPNRLSLTGEKRELYVIFTDLEGFTKLSHAIEPEMVATLLNRYLDLMSEAVLDHGGTIDKFVGDAVVAFWGAPISRPDDAERAAQCAVAMWRIGEEFRQSVPDGVPPVGRTRVGLHKGEAIVGNFGGEERIQYTALGDAMNTAARLEGANKWLETVALASGEAVEEVKTVNFRPLGRVTLSGRSTPVEIHEPVLEITAGSASLLQSLWRKFEQGDLKARDEIVALAGQNPGDAALQNFASRLKETEPGGSYVLQGK